MATSFLDKTGLGTLWAKIKSTFALKSEIPDSTSDLTNDSGFITSANIPQSDWNQNNSSANDYVKNRVCYTGTPTMTEVFYSVIPTGSNMRFAEDGQISFTEASAEVDTYSDLGGTAYSVTIGETTYTGTIQSYDQDGWFINIAGNPHMQNAEYTDNGMPFYTDFWVISVGDPVASDTRFSLSLSLPEIHKLDDKYLNGSLVKRGAGVYSVTLNGEFNNLTASGDNSVAEGEYSVASGRSSHAEGATATASGYASHAECSANTASGECSHAEGNFTTASAYASHTEGAGTRSSGDHSHSEGYYTTANHRSQHVFGEYNIADPSQNTSAQRGTYVEIVGNGVYPNNSNARTLDWNGNEVLAGKLTVGAAPTANMDVATKQYVDNAVAGSGGGQTVVETNPTLETEWVDVYSDWAAGYYYDPDNNYAYTQIPSTEMIWSSQTARTNTSCTPYSNLIPVKAGEEYRYQNTPIHFDSKNAEMPSIIIFDSTKSEVEAYTRTYQDEWTEFTIPANGAWMAVLYYNDQTYYLQKKEVAEDKFDILADVYANYRTYVNTAPPVLNTPTKGYICMGTDDLRRDQTKSLHELYTNANIPYFIAAIPENVKKCITDDPYKTNLDYMRLCVTAGGEIISHNTDQITAQNVDDFDFISKYFRGNKKELEAYGFTVNGIHKAGGSGYISGRDKRIDSWATAYYEHGDLFGYAYPYLAEREILEYIGSTSRIDDIVEDVCVNHGFAFITTHELSNDTQTMFNYLMNKLGQYTRGTDYEFVTPSQLYALLMPSTPPSSGGGSGTAITYTLSISNNVITLTGSNGSTSSVTLPVYAGGVSS